MKIKILTTQIFAALALVGAAALPVGAASTDINVGDVIGTSAEEVRSALTSRGYRVTEIEIEDDEIEAEVEQAGVALEIEIEAATGAVTEVEQDD